MKKLERLPWIDGFVVSGYGVRVGVRVNDPELLPLLRKRLPPGARITRFGVVDRMLSVSKGGAGEYRGLVKYHLLYADHTIVGRSLDLDIVFDEYDSHLRIAMAQYAHPTLFVHAGVVAWKGKAILFPGKSLSGKTHLVAELIKAGATYFSDEFAVLDAKGLVHPFPKSLSIREHVTARQRDVPAAALGGVVGRKPLPVGLVVMCSYDKSASWQPSRLTPGAGVLELLSNTFSARQRPEEALAILEQVVARAVVLKSIRGDARPITQTILNASEAIFGMEEAPLWPLQNRRAFTTGDAQ